MNVYLNMTLMWTSGTLITAFSPLVLCFSNCNYLGSVLSLLSLMKPLYSWLLQKNETVVELYFFFLFSSQDHTPTSPGIQPLKIFILYIVSVLAFFPLQEK